MIVDATRLGGDVFPEVAVSSYVRGAGMNVPPRVIPNDYFASYLETNDEWIKERTGIEQRFWAESSVSTSELAEPAARQAIARANLTPADIDGVLLATVTPDYIFPSTACFLQKRLGISGGLAFDINAVCCGFVYALATADSLIASGLCRNVLVVGVDLYSSILDVKDRTTCVLFGDGAGALVLSAAAKGYGAGDGRPELVRGSGAELRGIYSAELGADGSQTDILCVPNGTAARPTPASLAAGEHFLRMEGREVFKLAVRKLSEISERVLAKAGVSSEQVDYFATHQANKRIVTAMASRLDVPMEKVLVNVHKYGNTSAASLPILLAEAEQNGVLKEGHLVLMTAFGGGVTWGGVLLRW